MMNKNPRPAGARLSLALLALSAATIAGSVTLSRAQPNAKPQPSGAATDKSRTPGAVRFTARGEVTLDLERKVRHAVRNVQLWQEGEDFILYAEDVTHYGTDNTGTARGNLHLESRDSTIIGDLLQADFTEKMMTLTGNVVLKSHGEKDGLRGQGDGKTVRGEVLHKPSSLTCERLDYDYETRQATLTGSIRMRQGENFGTCDRILFDEARNIVRLIGNVKFINGDRQTIEVPEMTIWIDKNMIQSPGISTRIPDRKGRGNARTPRKPENLGDAPSLPPEILEGRDRKAPALAPPSKNAAPAKDAAPVSSPAASESKAAPTPSTSAPSEAKAEVKADDKPADTGGGKSG